MLLDWLKSLNANDGTELSQLSRALLICWQLWNERNDVIFRSTRTHPSRVLLIASSIGNDYFKANMKEVKKTTSSTRIIRWKAPSNHVLKIYFDGSVIGNKAAAGFVIRDSFGNPIAAGTRDISHNTISVAEALALRDALKFAHACGFTNVGVEGDSKLVIDAVKNNMTIPWRLKTIIRDIHHLASCFDSIIWEHIFREANFLADSITKLGHITTGTRVWIHTLPIEARLAHLFDCMGPGCTRGSSI